MDKEVLFPVDMLLAAKPGQKPMTCAFVCVHARCGCVCSLFYRKGTFSFTLVNNVVNEEFTSADLVFSFDFRINNKFMSTLRRLADP